MKRYATLSEVKRVCKKIASTEDDYVKYNELRREAEKEAPWEMVSNWGDFSIYSNGKHYITCSNGTSVLTLWKIVNEIYL